MVPRLVSNNKTLRFEWVRLYRKRTGLVRVDSSFLDALESTMVLTVPNGRNNDGKGIDFSIDTLGLSLSCYGVYDFT